MNSTNRSIIGCKDNPYNGDVFIIDCERKRWIPDFSRVKHLGFQWPNDVRYIGPKTMGKIPIGPSVPAPYSNKSYLNIRHDTPMEQAREMVYAVAQGKGIEFGASAHPASVPLGVDVKYADIENDKKLSNFLRKRTQIGDNFKCVTTDIISSLDTMENIDDESQDFIIASHVIEHVRNPLGAIESAYRKLRKDGRLILVVPRIDKTLDHSRPITPLEHLWNDYSDPSRDRDFQNITEFFLLAKPSPSNAETLDEIMAAHTSDHPYIHYHTWDEGSFSKMIKSFGKVTKWSNFKLVPCTKDGYEFYAIFTK